MQLKYTWCFYVWVNTAVENSGKEADKHLPLESRKMTNPGKMNNRRN